MTRVITKSVIKRFVIICYDCYFCHLDTDYNKMPEGMRQRATDRPFPVTVVGMFISIMYTVMDFLPCLHRHITLLTFYVLFFDTKALAQNLCVQTGVSRYPHNPHAETGLSYMSCGKTQT